MVKDKEASETIGKDILSLMIKENRKADAEGKLKEMELVDQVMTFLLAGHETTSTAVSLGIANLGMLDFAYSCATSGYPEEIT